MSIGGWIMFVVSWGVIIVLTLYCYARLLGLKRTNIRAPLEIDTEKD